MPSLSRLLPLALCAAPLLTTACATHYIPNTDVEDTSENRPLIAFCERYRNAVERQNIGELLKMASPDYYEDGGNADASDDIDYAGLQDFLGAKYLDAKAIRYEIRYRSVTRTDKAIFVDYTYSASFRIPGQKGDEWRRKVDDNRLEIVTKKINGDDEFRIVAGM